MKRVLILLLSALCLLFASCAAADDAGTLPVLRFTGATFPEEREELKKQIDSAMTVYSSRESDGEPAEALKDAGLAALEIYRAADSGSEELISARKSLKEAVSRFRLSSPASDGEMADLAGLILKAEEKGADTAEAYAVYISHPTSAEARAAIKKLSEAITG